MSRTRKLVISIILIGFLLVVAVLGIWLNSSFFGQGSLFQNLQQKVENTVNGENQAPSISIISPNGGEAFDAGQEIPITWKSTGINKISLSLIYYKEDGRAGLPDDPNYSFNSIECRLTYEPISLKSETFTAKGDGKCGMMPEGARIKVQIRGLDKDNATIIENNRAMVDESDSYFSIVAK